MYEHTTLESLSAIQKDIITVRSNGELQKIGGIKLVTLAKPVLNIFLSSGFLKREHIQLNERTLKSDFVRKILLTLGIQVPPLPAPQIGQLQPANIDVNFQNQLGDTALHETIKSFVESKKKSGEHKTHRIILRLLALGVDPKIKNAENQMATSYIVDQLRIEPKEREMFDRTNILIDILDNAALGARRWWKASAQMMAFLPSDINEK